MFKDESLFITDENNEDWIKTKKNVRVELKAHDKALKIHEETLGDSEDAT